MLKQQEYQVIAQSAGGEHYLLLPTGENIQSVEARGRILDVRQSTLSPLLRLHAVLKQGYWEPFEGDVEPVHAHVAAAREVEHPAWAK